jgi:hypothetical protein
VLVALAFGCGGGGEGGLQLDPPSLSASYQQGEPVSSLAVTGTLSEVQNRSVIVYVEQSAQDFDDLTIQVNPDRKSATAHVRPSCMLEPGTHSGKLTISVCRDQGCGELIARSELPYTLTVGPLGSSLTAELDGVPVPGAATHCTPSLRVRMTAGQTLTLTSTDPMTWKSELLESGAVPKVTDLTTTDTSWTATIVGQSAYNAQALGRPFGSVYITATSTTSRDSFQIMADVSAP